MMPFTKETASAAGKKGRAKQLSQAAECPKVPHELKVMRHVVTKPATKDKTEEQRNYRKWFDANPSSFMIRKRHLEDQLPGTAGPDGTGTVKPAMDPQTRRLLEEYERGSVSDNTRELMDLRDRAQANGMSERTQRLLDSYEGRNSAPAESQDGTCMSHSETPEVGNGAAAAVSSNAPSSGAAGVEPVAAEKPVEQRCLIRYSGYDTRWMTKELAIGSVAVVLGMKDAEVEQLIRSGQPVAVNLSQRDARRQGMELRDRGVVVSVEPYPPPDQARASNGLAAAVSGNEPPDGVPVEQAKPPVEEEPASNGYSVWYKPSRCGDSWLDKTNALDAINEVAGVDCVNLVRPMVAGHEPIASRLSLEDAKMLEAQLSRRRVSVSIKPGSRR
jgi:hypothetical protein